MRQKKVQHHVLHVLQEVMDQEQVYHHVLYVKKEHIHQQQVTQYVKFAVQKEHLSGPVSHHSLIGFSQQSSH